MIKHGTDLRKKMLVGIEALVRAVAVTLGPRGRNVCLEKSFGAPLVTKDGVSVAKEIQLSDVYENMGAKAVLDAASKTSEDAGDGTTTATVLAGHMCRAGMKLVEAGLAPIQLKVGMDLARQWVDRELCVMAFPVKSVDRIAQVATVSANGDEATGKILAEAIAKVGKDGVINIEEGKSYRTEMVSTDGMCLDRGWAHPEFCMDEARQESVLEGARVLVTDLPVAGVGPIVESVLTPLAKENIPLVIFAPDFQGNAIPTFIQNLKNNILVSCLVKAPGYGLQQDALLQDIAILTGARLISKALGESLEGVTLADLGTARNIRVTSRETVIVDGGGTAEGIAARVSSIRAEIDRTGSGYDADRLRARLGKLLGGVCTIQVGAHTETEMKELKARMEDALYATKAALEQGVVPGGGATLVWAADVVRAMVEQVQDQDQEGAGVDLPQTEDAWAGFRLVLEACEAPLRQIHANAGNKPDVVIFRTLEHESPVGCDASDGEFKDLINAGIIDPLKVTRSALANAVSVSSMFLTAGAGITRPAKQDAAPHAH